MSNVVALSNNPPGPIDHAKTVIDDINAWLADHPVIQTEDEACEAKPYLDRAKAALDEIEDERDSKVRPLNEQVSQINATYKGLHSTDAKKPGSYDRVVVELKARVAAFLIREEEKRALVAEFKRKAQEISEQLARDAEAREKEAIENAKAGELGVDVAAVTAEADQAFAEFEQASRFAARAERDTKVKVGGGFNKSASLRTVETLHLDSYGLALKDIGPNDKIRDAILSAARDYRKEHDKLPNGVRATYERKL